MTSDRRTFLRNTTLLSSGIFLTPKQLFKPGKPTIGLQLYTVRDAMASDPIGTLAKVAAIGYNSVEGATYTGTEKFYGMSPKDFKAVLNNNGLKMQSSHYRLGEQQEGDKIVQGTILHDWDRVVDDAATLGLKYMVCAFLTPSERGSLDHYKYVADQLNIAGERCKKSGIQLCYHNHNFEFIKQDGKYPYDILLGSDKDLVKMEMDIYWVTKARQNPISLFQAHPGRFPLWHVKDMDRTPEEGFAAVGTGIIDFKEIFRHKKEAGLKYFFVEQDNCPGSPFISIQESYSYIKRNLV